MQLEDRILLKAKADEGLSDKAVVYSKGMPAREMQRLSDIA
jgi:hypothetical protein